MKNKKAIYILLPIAILIWGLILRRIFSSSVAPVENASSEIIHPKADNHPFDTFSIVADYRDPFLGKSIDPEYKPSQTSKVKTPPKPVEPPVVVKWPKLGYSGVIENKKDGKQIAIVQVDGQENLMKLGAEIAGIQLMKIYKDSIQVTYEKERKTVAK